MAELKTTANDRDVGDFLATINDEEQRADAAALCQLMQAVTGEPPKMWGTGIIGFGTYHYKYKSGREGDWMLTGFAPRKGKLTVYVMDGYDKYQDLLQRLGKHSTAKSCLYLKRLSDINVEVLRELLTRSVACVRSGKFLL